MKSAHRMFSPDVYAGRGEAGGVRLYVRTEKGYVSHPVEFVRTKDLRADVRTWVRCMKEAYADYGMAVSPVEMIDALMTNNANRWTLPWPARAKAILYLMKELNRD